MKYFYHYTVEINVPKIKQTGIYPNHPYFTTAEYYDSFQAGQQLGVMAHNIECVLKFEDDGRFRRVGDVLNTGRFIGGGNQYQHPLRPKPIEVRKISATIWRKL